MDPRDPKRIPSPQTAIPGWPLSIGGAFLALLFASLPWPACVPPATTCNPGCTQTYSIYAPAWYSPLSFAATEKKKLCTALTTRSGPSPSCVCPEMLSLPSLRSSLHDELDFFLHTLSLSEGVEDPLCCGSRAETQRGGPGTLKQSYKRLQRHVMSVGGGGGVGRGRPRTCPAVRCARCARFPLMLMLAAGHGPTLADSCLLPVESQGPLPLLLCHDSFASTALPLHPARTLVPVVLCIKTSHNHPAPSLKTYLRTSC